METICIGVLMSEVPMAQIKYTAPIAKKGREPCNRNMREPTENWELYPLLGQNFHVKAGMKWGWGTYCATDLHTYSDTYLQ